MSTVSQEIQDDMALAREVLLKKNISIAVVKYGKIWREKKGEGIKPIFELIEEMGNELEGMVIGDRILGRASAFLCRYAKVRAVYSPQATKTAIAILIIGGIPCQVDELVPFIKNRDGNGLCPFEKKLKEVENPVDAYKILKTEIQ